MKLLFIAVTCLIGTLFAHDYPATPARETVHQYGPVQLGDDFAWLEEKNKETEAWFREQDTFARGMIGEMPGREELFQRIKEIDEAKTVQIYSFARTKERYFHLKREVGEEVASLFYRDGIDSESQLILDPTKFKTSDLVHSIQYYSPSYDGKLVGIAIAEGGNEIPDLYVVEVETGKVIEGPIPRARGYPAWLEDNSGFYYRQMRPVDPNEESVDRYKRTPVKFHRLGTDSEQDPIIISSEVNPTPGLTDVDSVYIFPVPESNITGLYISHGVDRSATLYFARDVDPEKASDIEWTNICTREDKIEGVDIHDDRVYLLSTRDAPRRKILHASLKHFSKDKIDVLLAQSERVLTDISILGGRLYVTGMEAGIDFLSVNDLSDKDSGFEDIQLPLIGRVTMLNNDYRMEDAYISLTSWTQAAAYYRYDPSTERIELSELRPLGPFDSPEGFITERKMVRSYDGIDVPLTIVRHESVELDGTNPTILYGYGAYGNPLRPSFGPMRLAWLERGGIFSVAHVRGGGELGKAWHEGGHLETKRNSWLDFNACAEYLIENEYAGMGTVAAMGGSMGGVLVGRAMTSRPDLYGAVSSAVGNHNPVRNHRRANGPANYPEYGNPLDPEEFPYVLAMDSYYAVRDGIDYPPTLLTSGYNDARVDPWMPGKFAARLQQANPIGGPHLMRVEFEAGHGGVARSDIWEEIADEYTFLFWALSGN